MKPSIKKYILSSFLVAAFVVYAFLERPANWLNSQTNQPLLDKLTLTGSAGVAVGGAAHLPVDRPIVSPPLVVEPTPPPPEQLPVSTKPLSSSGQFYKDGVYTGASADAYYGQVQVKIAVRAGKITDAVAINYPRDRQTSVIINGQATPILRSEALAAQSAQVDMVSGATYTSTGFIQSLASALSQAAPVSQSGQSTVQPPAPQPTLVPLPRFRRGGDD